MVCIRSKTHHRFPRTEHSHIDITKPGEVLFVDHLGPFPKGEKGYDRLFVIVDGFGKFTKLFPVKSCSSQSAINCLEKYIDQLKTKPKTILSDNATTFTSNKWKNHWTSRGVNIAHCSPYVPNGNVAERQMSKICDMLRIALINDKHNAWVKYIPDVQECLNNLENSTTRITPFTLMTGEPSPDPIIEILNRKVEPLDKAQIILSAIARMKQANDKRDKKQNKGVLIKVGDLVAIRSHILSNKEKGIAKKLCLQSSEPHKVTARTFGNKCTVQNLRTGKTYAQNVRNLWRLPDAGQPEPHQDVYKRRREKGVEPFNILKDAEYPEKGELYEKKKKMDPPTESRYPLRSRIEKTQKNLVESISEKQIEKTPDICEPNVMEVKSNEKIEDIPAENTLKNKSEEEIMRLTDYWKNYRYVTLTKVENIPASRIGKDIHWNGLDVVFCDGSCVGNGTEQARCGIGIYFGKNNPKNLSQEIKNLEKKSNNTAEISAVIKSLKIFKEMKKRKIEVRTDSNFLVKYFEEYRKLWLQNFEKNKKISWTISSRLLIELEEAAKDFEILIFSFVKSHSNIPGNIEADELARKATGSPGKMKKILKT
jgi:ribonuclease HI